MYVSICLLLRNATRWHCLKRTESATDKRCVIPSLIVTIYFSLQGCRQRVQASSVARTSVLTSKRSSVVYPAVARRVLLAKKEACEENRGDLVDIEGQLLICRRWQETWPPRLVLKSFCAPPWTTATCRKHISTWLLQRLLFTCYCA